MEVAPASCPVTATEVWNSPANATNSDPSMSTYDIVRNAPNARNKSKNVGETLGFSMDPTCYLVSRFNCRVPRGAYLPHAVTQM